MHSSLTDSTFLLSTDVTTTPGPPSSTTGAGAAVEAADSGARARAINFTTMADDHGNVSLADVDGNGHPEATTLRPKPKAPASSGERRLDDVSMDDEDNLDPAGINTHNASSTASTSSATSPSTTSTMWTTTSPPIVAMSSSTPLPTCLDTDGKLYVEGQRFSKACDQVCTCAQGKITCTPRCSAPLFRRGSARADPLCVEKDSDDPCCVLLVCSSDTGE